MRVLGETGRGSGATVGVATDDASGEVDGAMAPAQAASAMTTKMYKKQRFMISLSTS
jgi:hypothetical protein